MDCNHRLTFAQVRELMSHFYFGKPINYTCSCGQKCELSLSSGRKALCWAAALLALIIAEVILSSLVSGQGTYLRLLMYLVGFGVGIAAYYGMVYLMYRLGRFEYTAINYRAIVNRKRMNKR